MQVAKITLTAIFSFCVLGVTTSMSLADNHKKNQDKVKVGMITTLSGGGAGLGMDVRDGFMLAIKESGNKNVKVIVKDDQQKPSIAVQLADKLIQSEKVDVLTGIIWSNLAMAVIPAVVNQGKIYLSPNAGPSLLAGKGCHKNYFNVAWQNDALHEAAGAYAQKQGYKNIFVLAPNYPAGKDSITGFKRFYKGNLVGEVYSKLGQTDYAAEIAQMRVSGADSIFVFLPGGMGISFLKQYTGSSMDTPLISPAFNFSQDILPAVGGAALGMKNTSQWNKDLDNPANVAFVKAFQKTYNRLPSLYAAQGYDTAKLLLSAMNKASIKDLNAFRAALKEADFASTRGSFKFAANQHPIQNIYVREVVKEGDIYTNKIIETALSDHGDAYGVDCKL
jgi:branched-chain amino acid transport system substrate-binding protein